MKNQQFPLSPLPLPAITAGFFYEIRSWTKQV
ncbi:hypothetical protein SAMN05421790_105128 [Kroppenstedtia eburnea]|uniref:Uncharacterized protein n=1 Tax=Kroppenstedtia eburnea TaxID=714067 RepID=A0A1N7M0Y8_9BACL|nr:hypothetical protein SAMN05421790_105128 [Kroppenstedtia eburnea]